MSHLQTPDYRKENTPVSYWKHKNIYFLGFPCLDDCVFVCWCVYKVIHLEKLLHTFVQMWTKWNLKFNSSLVFRTWTLIQEAGSAKTLSFLSLTLHLCNGELWKCNLITFTVNVIRLLLLQIPHLHPCDQSFIRLISEWLLVTMMDKCWIFVWISQ